MQPSEMIREIGRLAGIAGALERALNLRIDDLRRELAGRLAGLERRTAALERGTRNGHGGKGLKTWLNLAAMGLTAATSLLGLIKPEVAAAILRGLWKAMLEGAH